MFVNFHRHKKYHYALGCWDLSLNKVDLIAGTFLQPLALSHQIFLERPDAMLDNKFMMYKIEF